VNKYSGDKIKESELDWECSTYGESIYKGFGSKKDGTRPIGRHNGSWEDNIKMNFQEVVWDRGLD
jgi:hypothetical protein